MTGKTAVDSNESRVPARILRPTLDAVVELRAIFSLSDDSSSQVVRTGFAIFVQSDMLITSSHILTPIDGYEYPSITCDGAECVPLKFPPNMENQGFHHLSYLRLKTVGNMSFNNVAIFSPTFLDPLWTFWAVPDKKQIVGMTVLGHCSDGLVLIAGPDMIPGTPIFDGLGDFVAICKGPSSEQGCILAIPMCICFASVMAVVGRPFGELHSK